MSQDNENWLLHDHRRWTDLLAEFRVSLEMLEWDELARRFAEFSDVVDDHMRMEDAVIFPAYEQMVGTRDGTVKALRREHDLIRACLATMSRSLEYQDRDALLGDLDNLEKVLSVHHHNEEELFLPMASLALLDRRDQVLERLARREW